jgi:predicted RNA binding protein YcfA (HicA-like mRNA interferase family)
MSRWTPCKRSQFIRRLRRLGFRGLFSGTRHQFLVHAEHRLAVPSNREYSVDQLQMILREVGKMIGRQITVEEWGRL